ncbi:hypothetical protein [Sinomicrobium sp. M5D2P17]
MTRIITILAVLTIYSCNTNKKNKTLGAKDIMQISSVQTTISTNKDVYKTGEPIELSLEVKNTGNKPYTFLPWGTPLENKFTGGCLKVADNNGAIDYKGIMVKRVSPTEKDSITLETGKTAVGKVNLLDGYKLKEKGIYTIQFEETYNGLPASNTIKVEIE